VTSKSAHIGIVACSAEGAALCYRTICIEGAKRMGGHAHPEVSLHSHSLADYVACLDRGDVAGVADLMLSSAEKLAKTGADFLICPDNTIHAAFVFVAPRSPLPWLHIAEVVAEEARAKRYRRPAITGTKWLVDSDVYPEKLSAAGLDYRRPRPEERELIDRIIMDELVHGVFDAGSTARMLEVIARFKREEDCDAVILGCTELPLVIGEENSPLPVLDSTRLLARAALKKATDTSR
jgi:aspartate racemase